MCGWQVKLCDPIVTHGPYLSALETGRNKALYKFTFAFNNAEFLISETDCKWL